MTRVISMPPLFHECLVQILMKKIDGSLEAFGIVLFRSLPFALFSVAIHNCIVNSLTNRAFQICTVP